MEGDAFEISLLVCVLEHFVQMPCNGLSFAVRVGSQINFFDRLCSLLEIGEVFPACF